MFVPITPLSFVIPLSRILALPAHLHGYTYPYISNINYSNFVQINISSIKFSFFAKVEAFRKAVNEHFSSDYSLFLVSFFICLSLEQLSEGQQYDARDINRFHEVDEYTFMFIQHGQYGKTFDEQKSLRQFHDAMVWRKQNNVYGKFFSHLSKIGV